MEATNSRVKSCTGSRDAMSDKNPAKVNPLAWAQAYLNADEYQELLDTFEQPLDISIRINTLKSDPKKAIAKWCAAYGWKAEPIPFCPAGFWIKSFDVPPAATIEHRLGYFYIQEAASMLPPELFNFSGIKNPIVLDMAASPGGKATHLTMLTGDNGLVIANDGNRQRITALQIVLGNWGAAAQAVTCLPGEGFGDLTPDTFDAVLLDAPCSMQGLRTAESHTPKPITQGEIDSLAARQMRLLESALLAVKPGGQVVYSTCSLAPQEDELVLAALLERYPGLFQIEDVSTHLPKPAPALTDVYGTQLPDQVRNALRLWPHLMGTAGFFTAKLTKLERFPERGRDPWQIPSTKAIYELASVKATKDLVLFLKETYGFDLAALMERSNLEIVFHQKNYTVVSRILRERFKSLPILSAGMPVTRLIGDDLLISHEFVSRFGDKFTRGTLILEDEHTRAWLRGEDIRGYRREGSVPGRIYAIRDGDGRNLGRGKLLADRLKNMLPTRLF
jgi:16S rRNA (cytosine1407-C5)-methyltransferase